MRPLILKIRAFGPFVEDQVIDFSEMGDGVFLIAGKTGSGKTSVFDAIAYALFGEASGTNRESKFFRSDFAEPEQETEVELTFTHHGQEFLVKRSPSYKRQKISGGETTVAAKASLTLPDGQLFEKISEVDAKITEIIGLDAKQFRQTSMLAQGEFSSLLSADSDQRANVFRKIFGTETVAEIQNLLREETRSKELEVTQLEEEWWRQVSLFKFEDEALKEEVKTIIAERASYDFRQVPMQEWVAQQASQNQEEIASLKESIDQSTKVLDKLKQELHTTSEWFKQKKIWQKLDLEYKEVVALEQTFSVREREVTWLNELHVQVAPLVKRFLEQETRGKSLEISLSKAKQQLEDNKIKLSTQRAIKAKLDSEEEIREKEKAALYALRETLPRYQEYATLCNSQAELKKKRNTQTAELLELREKIAQLAKEESDLDQLSNQLPKFVSEMSETKSLWEKFELRTAQVDVFSKKCDLLIQKENKLTIFRTQVQECLQTLNALQKQKTREEKVWLAQEAAHLALELKPNEPCPVCGSTNHPMPALPRDSALSSEELKELQTAFLDKENNYKGLRQDFVSDEASLEVEWKVVSGEAEDLGLPFVELKELQSLSTETKSVRTREWLSQISNKHDALQIATTAKEGELKDLREQQEKAEKAREKLKSTRASLDKLDKDRESLERELDVIVSNLTQGQERITKFADELRFASLSEAENAIKSSETSLKKWQDNRRQAEEKVEQILLSSETLSKTFSGIEGQLEVANTDFEETKRDLRQTFQKYEIVDVEQFKEDYRVPEIIKELEKRLQQEKERYLSVSARREEFLKNWDQTKQVRNLEEIELDIQKESKSLEVKRETHMTLKHSLEANAKLIQYMDKLGGKLEQLADEYSELKELSDVANGTLKGGLKRDFESYVQGYYLRQILHHASQRLGQMSHGRFQLAHQMGSSDKRKKTGLDIEVQDHYTGLKRPLSTLSGGESFMTALALALALSDVAQAKQGGLQIETLFIDEGFGSLDRESLREAIRTLEQLSADQYLCGIISHVEELKEVIPRQLIVVKTDTGSHIQYTSE